MELDKRIIDGKKPLDCFDVNIAEQFVGKKGYVTDFLQDFCDLNKVKTSKLKTILHTELFCYLCGSIGKKYFLPIEWVEEPKKKYRPFTLDEFTKKFSLGDEIIMRSKNNPTVTHVLFIEYEEGRDDVRLGQCWYTFMVLFNNYELYTDEGWKPFGVEE